MTEITIPLSGWDLNLREYGENLADVKYDLEECVEYRAFVRTAAPPDDWDGEGKKCFPKNAKELVLIPQPWKILPKE